MKRYCFILHPSSFILFYTVSQALSPSWNEIHHCSASTTWLAAGLLRGGGSAWDEMACDVLGDRCWRGSGAGVALTVTLALPAMVLSAVSRTASICGPGVTRVVSPRPVSVKRCVPPSASVKV